MTGRVVIQAEGISKLYRIGARDQINDSLVRVLFDLARSPISNFHKYRSLYRFDDVDENTTGANVIWALSDVSFNVREGEVLGIVGRNGAGKSTLLKILSRITPPTRGQIDIHGRVSSLLEVGTGFHQELTGRENVYLNGTILGMRKKEVDRKFDEIVDFSGVEKFLDTPVKRYSSGMAVRLAFAVAAHLEPDILIIDEVLAVGDVAFQKKCINKMQDVGREGRTVLFVSHNMPAVKMLCSRAILLNDGRIEMDASAHDVVSAYVNTDAGVPAIREWLDPRTAPGGSVASLHAVRIVLASGQVASSVDIRESVGIEMEYDVVTAGHVLMPHCYVYNDEGLLLFGTLDQDPAWREQLRPEGRYKSTVWIPGNFLPDGRFYVSCALISRSTDTTQFYEKQIVGFSVTDNMGAGTARGSWAGWFGGVVRPVLDWETSLQSSTKQAVRLKGS